MARLLVTGGAGFIGANFVHHWAREHPADRIVVLDALTYAGNRANLEPVARHSQLRFVHGDICDRPLVELLLREEDLDTIVHFAAESHVDRSIVGPDAFVRTNVLGTQTLLDAARAVWLAKGGVHPHRFHHVSTDEVYGTLASADPAFSESSPYSPNSPYAASKAASDHLVRAYHHTYGLAATISNCSNNYGPYQFPEKLVPLAIVNVLLGRDVPLYGDGRQVRDWLHVTDHCRGIERVLLRGQPGEVYNIGARCERQNVEIIRMLCAIADQAFQASPGLIERFPRAPAASKDSSTSLIRFVRDRPGHDRRYAINCDRIEREFQYRASVSLEEGLNATFRWYLDNEPWWRAVMDGSYREWIHRQYGQPPAFGSGDPR